MGPRLGTIASLLWLGLLSLGGPGTGTGAGTGTGTGIGIAGVAAKARNELVVNERKFESIPQNLFYFEDSDVVLVTDVLPGIVYRSDDAGSSWSKVGDIDEGQIFQVLQHPYDNSLAVAIGIQTTHWITRDRGNSWTRFTTKFPAVITRPPISFHATDPDRMIFHVADCLMELLDCTEKVSALESVLERVYLESALERVYYVRECFEESVLESALERVYYIGDCVGGGAECVVLESALGAESGVYYIEECVGESALKTHWRLCCRMSSRTVVC